MLTPAEYADWKSRQQEQEAAKANIVLSQPFPSEPDQFAADVNLAREAGSILGNSVPLAMVQDQSTRSVFDQIVAEKKRSTILTQSPRLSEWLRVPDNAAVARDNLEGMSWWETVSRATGNALIERGGMKVGQSYNQWMAEGAAQRAGDQGRSFGDIYAEERANVGPIGVVLDNAVGPITDVWNAGARLVQSRLAEMFSGDQEAAAAYYQQQVGLIGEKIAATPMSPGAEKIRGLIGTLEPTGDVGTDLTNFLGVVATDPAGFTAFLAETAAETAPSLAAAFAAGAATRNPTAFAGVLGGASYLQERYLAPADLMAERGIDISTPEGAIAAITDADLMRDAAQRGEARGLIIGALDTISGGVAGETLSANPILNLVLQSLIQSAFGGGGEALAQMASGQQFNISDVMIEGLAEFVTAPIEVGGMAASSLRDGMAKAPATVEHIQTMTEMAQRAATDPVRNRMPDAFRDYLRNAMANTGSENLFIPADQFVQYFQSQGIDPFELADNLTGMSRDEVQAAFETGGHVKIPTATWAADMAGSQHDQFVIQNSVFSPDAMTATEAAEFNASAQSALEEAWIEAEAIRTEAEELRQIYDQEREELIGRLRSAGRALDVASAEALSMVEFRRVMAERMGFTPEEFAARYPLPRVEGQRPEGLDPKNVDELTRTLAEARARRAVGLEKRGPSILEFISEYGGILDPGGELRARDAAVIRRPGKKSLKLERGTARAVGDMFGLTGGKAYGFDDVARAAIEAGYLADDPVALEYLEAVRDGREVPDIGRALLGAIDRELRGEQQFAGQPEAVADDGLDSIEEYLAGLGLSLDDADTDIRAALDGQGQQFGQADAGFPGGGGRGSIQFPVGGIAGGETMVSLFQRADLSTFLHESGHYFLTVMKDAASLDPEGPLAREFETVKAWWHQNAADVAQDAGNGVTADDVRAALDNGTSGSLEKDSAIDVGLQEQFARAAEQYFMEGKAPSPSLRQAFEKFRAWLVSIYRTMRGLNVALSDELRGVFDRMMATDAEIAQARTAIGADVALSAADLGMTEEQFANFLRLRDQAKADASAKLLAETMAPIRRAREQWFKDERKKVRDEVERNTNAQPVYRAIEWMGNRRWLGEAQPEDIPDIRFSKDVLVERYGAGVLDTLPRGRFTVYAVDGGVNPDDAAGWFGFSSGDAMVKAMERAPNRKEVIEAETDKVMRERHGDVLRDGSVEQQAIAAVHTDSRARELATELQAMNEIAGTARGLTAKDAREMARRTLSQMRTRDALNSGRFLAAERKAAAEVARLAATVTRQKMWIDAAARRVQSQARALVRGEATPEAMAQAVEGYNAQFETTQTTFAVSPQTRTSAAGRQYTIPGGERTATNRGYNEQAAALVEAKRRQLLNHALYSEALAIADEVGKAERLVARLSKAIQRRRAQEGKQTISNESLDAIGEIIERYDFRKLSGRAEDRRGALNRYLEAMVAQGRENEIAIPKKVLTEAAKLPYKTLAVADLRGVVDTLRNLESTGRRWQRLLIAGKEREFNSAIDTIVTALTDNIDVKPKAWVEAGWKKSAKGAVNQYLATFTTASTVIRHMDGRKDLGPVYDLLKADIDSAAYNERDMKAKAADQIEALYSVYSQDEQRDMAVMRSVPALGGKSFSKWHLISMALNMGNEGNLHRLTNRKARQHLTPAEVDIVKGLLEKTDWDFVQSVWDYLDTFRPMIEERQKRTTGVAPEWVEAAAVETPHGSYRGGYYPIKYARDQGGASTPSLNGDTDIIQSMKLGSYAKAATKNGHLETRVKDVQQSLLLDVGVIAQHTNEVIHDLAFSEAIVNTWRMLNDQRVSTAMLDAGMQEQQEALKLWLKDVAVGQVFASDFMSRAVRTLRSGFTVSRLAFNVGTALLQPTGLMQSAVIVGKKNLASAIMAYTRDPVNVVNDVIAKSRTMGERREVFQKDLMDMVAETSISSPTASRFKEIMDRYAVPASLSLMMYTQYYVVDVPTWMAAYSKGMAQFGGDQQRAAQYADMTINRVQGSGLWSERSNIERGTLSATVRQNAFVTLFTTLGSYFFAKMNLMIERTNALRGEQVTVGAAVGYAFDMALLLAGEAAVLKLTGAAIEAAFGGGDDDGEDENLALFLGAESLKTFAGGLPGIRDAVSVYQGFSGGTYASLLDLVVKPAREVSQGEFDKGLVKSFVNLAGVTARLPAAQANRIIDAGWRAMDGEDVTAMEYLLGKR